LMIDPRIKDTAKELCEQLVETYMAKNKKIESEITAQIKTKRILLQFILEMWEKGFVIENDKSGRNTVEKEIISYVQQNFKEKISLKEFGEQFHLSEKYISRYFKEHFHITLSQYITHLRLEYAKQLLQDTDTPVTEIAMQSGYQNVSYFIRSFKKAYGVSPLKYKKK
ncbi:helix-turn-helix domain-containing protein, partial [[Ruminococcus] torques]